MLVLFPDAPAEAVREGFVGAWAPTIADVRPFATFLRAAKPRCGPLRDRQKNIFDRDADVGELGGARAARRRIEARLPDHRQPRSGPLPPRQAHGFPRAPGRGLGRRNPHTRSRGARRARSVPEAARDGAPPVAAHGRRLRARSCARCSRFASASRSRRSKRSTRSPCGGSRRKAIAKRLGRAQRRAPPVGRAHVLELPHRDRRSSRATPGVHVQAPKAPRRLPATLDADQVASLLAISGDDPDHAARPRDARALLFVGPAARGARRAQFGRRRRGRSHRARRRQGLESARRAGRQAGARGAPRLARRALASSRAPASGDVRRHAAARA